MLREQVPALLLAGNLRLIKKKSKTF